MDHHPLWRVAAGKHSKNVAKKFDDAHAELFEEWVKSHIEMDSIITKMRWVSKEALEAAPIIAKEEQAASKTPQK